MASKKSAIIVIIIILSVIFLFVVVSVIIYVYLRLRRKKNIEEYTEEDEEDDEEALAVQKAIIEKTPLGAEQSKVIEHEEEESLLICRLGAESKKYDQEYLWKKYRKNREDSNQNEECCLNNGLIKLEFYHQSYSQIFRMKIIHARGLKCQDPNKELTTRVKILLITPLKTRHIPRRTHVVKNSNNPDYNEVLEINLTRKTTRDSTVEVSVWSIDDFYKESLIGGLKLDLKRYDVAQRNVVEKELQVEFEEHENPGYIMVSLSYNKEDEKLTVIVMRGKLLKCAAHEDTLLQETINPYVKVCLFCNKKRIKMEKTETKKDQINPVFNTVMEFFVPEATVNNTNIVFVVMHEDVRTDSKENIGRIEIGSDSTGECSSHWKKALSAEGRPVAQWHQLWY